MTMPKKPKELLKKAIEGNSLTKDEINIIASNAQCSKLYAQKVLEGRFVEGEEIIKTNPAQSYLYAKDVIKSRWTDGEEIISKDPFYSLNYAQNILCGRFGKGENAISSNGNYSLSYAKEVLRRRFVKGEKTIINDCNPADLAYYSINLIKARWPEAEDKILKDSNAACDYACHFAFRWPEAEEIILTNSSASVDYACKVIGGRWPEAEEIIAKSSRDSLIYAENIEERFELGEDSIIQEIIESYFSRTMQRYHTDILKNARWEKLEDAIKNFNGKEEVLTSIIYNYFENCSEDLPEFIHNRMIALAITNQNDYCVKLYFSSLENREEKEKLALVKRFSLEKLREILSSVDV